MNSKYVDDIYNAEIFNGLTLNDITQATGVLNVQIRTYSHEDLVHRAGEYISTFGLVLNGDAIVESSDILGNRVVLGHAGKGRYFAETFSILNNEPVYFNMRAASELTIAFFDMSGFLSQNGASYTWANTFLLNLLKIISQKNQLLVTRSLITAVTSVRDRILLFLDTIYRQKGSKVFDISYSRQELADYLEINRSALSRELSKMQKDHIITYHLNHFTINI